jgi:hypothetical protein
MASFPDGKPIFLSPLGVKPNKIRRMDEKPRRSDDKLAPLSVLTRAKLH